MTEGSGVRGKRHVVIVPEATQVTPRPAGTPADRAVGRPIGGPSQPTPPPVTARRAARQPSSAARVRRRRWPRRVVLAVVLLPVLLIAAGLGVAWWKFEQIPRVDVAAVLSPSTPGGTNYLVVGTDSRAGITADDPNAGAFLGEKVSGTRTDTIMVLRVGADGTRLLSLPRDLWVRDPKTGEMGRINATFNSGAANLIRAVQAQGIPVQHYLEINFVSFAKLVDAVGGIVIDFPHAARDTSSGLNITTAGPQQLDGMQALAFVRARHLEELINGKWVADPLSDLSRVQRQRQFLAALVNKVSATRNPLELGRISDALSVGMHIDNALSFPSALGLVWSLRGFSPLTETVPVTARTTAGGADVLDFKQPEAKTMLSQYAT